MSKAGLGARDGNSHSVVIVEDHPMMASGLRAFIDDLSGVEVREVVDSTPELIQSVSHDPPDLVVLDMQLREGCGLDAIKQVRRLSPDVRILIYSMLEEDVVGERCVRAGADGYLMKDQPIQTLATAIRTVLGGEPYLSSALAARIVGQWRDSGAANRGPDDGLAALSDREWQVLSCMAAGQPNREVADKLGISVKTVERHVENLKIKLDQPTTAAVRAYGVERFSAGTAGGSA